MSKRIPIEWQVESKMLKPSAAAARLGIGRTTLWMITKKGLLHQCCYGLYHIDEVDSFANDRLREARGERVMKLTCRISDSATKDL